jgi:cytochrome c553
MQHERSEMMRCRPGIARHSKLVRSRICGASLRAASRAGHGFALTVIVLLCTTPAFAAGSIAAGRQKAQQCQTCHGLDGLSKLPDAPNIAGSPEPYLARQLNAFRKGERKNEMMSIVVQPLSDQDIADLAAYYAAIELTAKPPR